MIQIILIKNPFEPDKRELLELYYTGKTLTNYVDIEQRDIYRNGGAVEDAAALIPQDGDQLVIVPHIAGGAIKKVLGFAAMIALTVYAGGVAGGAWGGIFKAGSIAATLASGAVMFLGGKIINSIFPQQDTSLSFGDQNTSQTYGWDIPTPTTMAGNIVGETYGECMPAAQLLEQHVETVNDEQYLNLLYCGGYGPVDSIDRIRIDYTDIGNFNHVELETRLGTNDQKPISFFKNTPLDQSVGIELDEGKSAIRTSDSSKASSLEVTMEWPSGLFYVNDDNSYGNATVKFKLEYRLTGTTVWSNFNADGTDYEVTAASNSAVRRTYSVTGLASGQYDVRATVTSRPHTTRYQTMTQWTLLTSYIDGIYSRPGKVLVAMRILATSQLSSGVPSVNWRQTRSTVHVWDPDSETYVDKPADNPIWAAYDILHHCRKLTNINTGAVEYVADGVPKEALSAYFDQWQSAADYADEKILNQDGEQERRYRFDAMFDTSQKRITAAQKAATIGHASIVPHGRNYGIVVDRPGTITQIFGEGRTTVSSVKGAFSSKEDRARAIEVTYNDADNDFKNTVMTVRSPNYNTDNATDNTAQLSLFGVKSRSQAYREAITALATNERQLQSLELSADIDAIVAEYGDIIGYNHAVSRIGVASGRIVAISGQTITLDKDVTLEAARHYEIHIQLSTDVLVKREIAQGAVNGRTLTIVEPFDQGQLPERFDNYALGEVGKAVKPFRIVSASRDGDLKVTLKLAEYDEAVYATELDYSKYPVIDYTDTPVVGTVRTVTASEQSCISGNTGVSDVLVEWTVSDTGKVPDSYTVELSSRNSAYADRLTTRMTSCAFHGVRPKETYDITVRCVFDAVTIGAAATVLYVEGAKIATLNISGLSITQEAGGLRLSWNPSTDSTVAGYDVYQGEPGAELVECTCISRKQSASELIISADGPGRWQFWVCAVGGSGAPIGTAISGMAAITLPGAITNAEAVTIYRQYADGSTGYDIVVTYALPNGASTGLVYYKTNHVDMTEIGVIPEGTSADDIGYTTAWKYAGDGTGRVTIPAAQLGDTYRIRLLAKDAKGWVSSDEDACYLEVQVKAKTNIPDTPQAFACSIDTAAILSWNAVTNTDIDYYEIRTNPNPGAQSGLLIRVQDVRTVVTLTSRQGTIYLYAHNTTGKYSYPAKVDYRVDKPSAPSPVTFTEVPLGITLTVPVFPSGVHAVKFYITSEMVSDTINSSNSVYTYQGTAGIYSVRACYVDLIGEGYASQEYTMTINPTFKTEWLADESISLSKVDTTLKTAVDNASTAISRLDTVDKNIVEIKKTTDSITSSVQENKKAADDADALLASQIKQTAESITSTVQAQKSDQDKINSGLSSQIEQTAKSVTSVVTNLNGDGSEYSALTQLQNDINLRIEKDKVISQINLSSEGATIDGKYLHVTGTTKIDNDVIVGGMIKAGSISADKLSASKIALTGGQGFKGGAVTLDADGLTVGNSNGSYVTHNGAGMTFHNKNGGTFSMVGAMVMGVANNGQYVKFSSPWDRIPSVFVMPLRQPIMMKGYTNAQLTTVTEATEVTTNGFRVNCKLILGKGVAHQIGNISIGNKMGILSLSTYVEVTIVVKISLTYKYEENHGSGGSGTHGYWKDENTSVSHTFRLKKGNDVLATAIVNCNKNDHSSTSEWKSYDGGIRYCYYIKEQTIKLSGSFPAGSSVGVYDEIKTNSIYGGSRDSSKDIVSISAYDSVINDTVVSTGQAVFLAIDATNASYTLQ